MQFLEVLESVSKEELYWLIYGTEFVGGENNNLKKRVEKLEKEVDYLKGAIETLLRKEGNL